MSLAENSLELEGTLLSLLPADGTSTNNVDLREQLGVDPDTYWRTRNSLLEKGLVTRTRGRGGKTARVVATASADGDDASPGAWMVWALGALAFGLFLCAASYGAFGSGDNWVWNTFSLASAATTVAGVAIAVQIFRIQSEMQVNENRAQVIVYSRLENLTRQAVQSSRKAVDFLDEMSSAADAALDTSEPAATLETAADEAPVPDAGVIDGNVYRDDQGEYYRPSAVPLRLVADIVNWWSENDENGRWSIENLVGGYRRFNSAGTLAGVPWILTFRDSSGCTRDFRISYSGRKKQGEERAMPTVSEHGGEHSN